MNEELENPALHFQELNTDGEMVEVLVKGTIEKNLYPVFSKSSKSDGMPSMKTLESLHQNLPK